jgi:Cu2+-containing amine oxidase
MVISSIATVGNYEYGFFWYLYQDGSIELQIKMTGIVSTGGDGPRCRARARRPDRTGDSTRPTISTGSTSGWT